MAVERTLVLVKPDGVARRLVGEVISRIERKGLKIVALKMLKVSREQAERHYAVHKGKPFYESLLAFITSGPVVAMVVEGESAIEVVRNLMGPTSGLKAPAGTIRGDFSLSIQFNIVHGSDSPESAAYEIPIFFDDTEILKYKLPDETFMGGD
ncbi:MAG: nucleoside-diphosphate kinase [Planctomycetota bacterium]|nr:MAG: nucleoside-diphosphate kinase [Planctomycetota bacterium]